MKKILTELLSVIPKNQKAYLVGGYVRDKILNRRTKDYDIVIQGDINEILERFSRRIGRSLLRLNEKNPLWRIVLKERKIAFDFTPLTGNSIENDLSNRDFTINAMAIELDKYLLGVSKIIDPFGGFRDILDKKIRVVKDSALISDPLRMLRAFRFSAQLGFFIEESTIHNIRQNADKILNVSFERINNELFLIFAEDFSYPIIRQLDNLGLLGYIIPQINDLKGLEQGKYHHLDTWEHTLLAYKKLEEAFNDFPKFDSIIRNYLDESFQSNITKRQLIKFAVLLHDIGKPITRTKDEEDNYHFYNHAKVGEKMAESICFRLKLGKKETAVIKELVKRHLDPLSFLNNNVKSKKAFNRFFNRNGSEGVGVLLLFLADMRAARGKNHKKSDEQRLNMIEQMFKFRKEQLEPHKKQEKLLNGKDLIEIFNLNPDKKIGEILRRIEDEQIDGTLKSKEDAIEFVKTLIYKKD